MSEEDEHANQNELSEEFIENFKENIFTHFFDDELEQKGLDRDDLEKGQVLLRTPFALSQFDDLENSENNFNFDFKKEKHIIDEILYIVENAYSYQSIYSIFSGH